MFSNSLLPGIIDVNIETRPISEICHRATRNLFEKMGGIDTIRFLNQFSIGQGNYTKNRERWLGDISMKKPPPAVLKHFLEANRAIKFAYLFGSHARDAAGPLSDVDLAVYLDNRFDFFSFRLRLLEELSRQLKGQPCDLVVLNNASLVLQYEVIRGGKVLKENKQTRVQFETNVIREYLDTALFRSVHLSALKRSFIKEHHLGE